jgi:hypothetical protein
MKNFKLSFTDNTTFYGKDLEGFYANALLRGASKEAFKLIPDVKSTAKIGKLNLGSILQDADCSFSSTGEGTLSQKTVTAQDVKINLEYCQRTFERDYLSQSLRAGSNSDGSIMPASVEEFLLAEVAKKISNDLEYITWQGSGATVATNFISEIGLQAKLLADADVIDVSAVTLSSTVIVAQINRVYDVIPTAVKQSAELAIFMNAKTAGFYKQAQAASYTGFYSEDQKLTFLGVPIIVAGGLGDNKMVAAEKNNFLLLTDLMSDFSEVLILPQKSVTGAPVIRMVGDFKFGVDYVYGSEIVYYN